MFYLLLVVLSSIINIAITLTMLYYLYQLKYNKACSSCEYSNNWRHGLLYMIGIYNIIIILIGLSFLIIPKLKEMYNTYLPLSLKYLLVIIHSFIVLLYVYSFFSYIGMHEHNKCSCLVSENPLNTVHRFLNIWRYVVLFFFMLSLLLPVLLTFYTLVKIDIEQYNKNSNTKK